MSTGWSRFRPVGSADRVFVNDSSISLTLYIEVYRNMTVSVCVCVCSLADQIDQGP